MRVLVGVWWWGDLPVRSGPFPLCVPKESPDSRTSVRVASRSTGVSSRSVRDRQGPTGEGCPLDGPNPCQVVLEGPGKGRLGYRSRSGAEGTPSFRTLPRASETDGGVGGVVTVNRVSTPDSGSSL